MTQPFSATSCGECFESWSGPEVVPDEVEIHAEYTDHRYDIKTETVE